jgi:hypothetical protein
MAREAPTKEAFVPEAERFQRNVFVAASKP